MKKTFACAVRPNKAPSMRRGLSIISLEHSYGLNGSRIFDQTQLAPKCTAGSVFRQSSSLWTGSIPRVSFPRCCHEYGITKGSESWTPVDTHGCRAYQLFGLAAGQNCFRCAQSFHKASLVASPEFLVPRRSSTKGVSLLSHPSWSNSLTIIRP